MRTLLSSTLWFGVLLLSGCGGGAIAGIIAGSNNGSGSNQPPELRLPALEIPNNSAPIFLFASDFVLRALTVRNVTLQPPYDPARVRIEISSEQLGLSQKQITIAITNVEADRFTLTFQVQTAAFLQHFTGATKHDVNAKLRVLVDGQPVAPDGDFVLLQPPQIDRIVSPVVEDAVEVSVDGSSRVTLELSRLLARDGADVTMSVFQRNPLVGSSEPDAIRVLDAEQLAFECLERDSATGLCTRARVSVIAPPSKFPGVSVLYVHDRGSGWQDLSAPVRLLYAPVLDRLTPDTASVNGSVPAVLLGTGLVPARNDTGEIEYRFDAVELTLIKGGARLDIDPGAIRTDLSNDQQLFFRLPRSPDGLPGAAVLEIRQRFEDDRVRTVTKQLGSSPGSSPGARFGIETPLLSHRITPLLRQSEQMLPGDWFPGGLGGEELLLLSRGVEYGQVAMLRAAGSGVYREAGRPINIVGPLLETGRHPLCLVPGPFGFATMPAEELLVISNAGAIAPATGTHALLRATSQVETPFTVLDTGLFANEPIGGALHADFDGDGYNELVLAHQPESGPRSLEIWSRFGSSPTSLTLPLPAGLAPDRVSACDLDGDGALDLVAVDADTERSVVYWFGDGQGGFSASKLVSYAPTAGFFGAASEAVAICAVPNQANTVDLYCVLGRSSMGGRQWVVPVPFDTSLRALRVPAPAEVLELGSELPAVRTAIAMQLDGTGKLELVLGTAGGIGAGLLGIGLERSRPELLPAGVVPPEPEMRSVAQLQEAQLWNGGREKGLIVLHEEETDQGSVPAISALPLTQSGLASRRTRLESNVQSPQAVLLGDWNADGDASDVLVASPDTIEIHLNDAHGLFVAPPERLSAFDAIPGSLKQFGAGSDELVWLERSGLLVHYDLRSHTRRSRDVRAYIDGATPSGLLGNACGLQVVDYDRDGKSDVCLWLVPEAGSPQASGVLVALRGVEMQASDVPFARTDLSAVQVAPPQFQGFRVASILPFSEERRGVEACLLGPRTVVFFVLFVNSRPEFDRFEYASFVIPDLRLDSDPTAVLFADLAEMAQTATGPKDMAVLAGGRLRFYRNRFVRTGDVITGKFEALSDLAYPGEPIGLTSGDFNGDGLHDVFVLSRSQGRDPAPHFCLFAGLGSGSYRSCYVYPPTWHAIESFESFATGDLDGNGIDDLVLGHDVLLSR